MFNDMLNTKRVKLKQGKRGWYLYLKGQVWHFNFVVGEGFTKKRTFSTD
jgi:hypothetical protein